ncbi:hypothetical protein [Pseudomonas sp. NPDC096950]|uniref:hypothetical protein n=1 Tax=Pseudomonas sp. NPDC096950 TaxID=3364485 RepID=UPI00383AB9F1
MKEQAVVSALYFLRNASQLSVVEVVVKRDDSDNKIIRAAALWNRIVERESKDPVERLRNLPLASNSALHARLLEGIPPLRHRPPTRNGSPWYEVIETEDLFTVSVRHVAPLHFDIPGAESAHMESEILIEGDSWRVETIVAADQEYVVSWPKYPLRWKLWRDWMKHVSLADRFNEHREMYGEWYVRSLGQEAANVKLSAECDDLERDIRANPDQRIDKDGVIWRSEWRLKLTRLPGWPWTGRVTEFGRYVDLVPVSSDANGDLALYAPSTGESWVRIDYCYYEGTGRFIAVNGLSLAGLELAVRNFDSLVQTVMDMTVSTFKIMDRERDGIVLRKYMVPAAALPWRR